MNSPDDSTGVSRRTRVIGLGVGVLVFAFTAVMPSIPPFGYFAGIAIVLTALGAPSLAKPLLDEWFSRRSEADNQAANDQAPIKEGSD